mmetsp:Transcript_13575/g.32316  ORF Transcript_13575/g.32316 Transcript_13575/m.32316 type:complete len:200 (+) Transcript_13575:715-1314(+)
MLAWMSSKACLKDVIISAKTYLASIIRVLPKALGHLPSGASVPTIGTKSASMVSACLRSGSVALSIASTGTGTLPTDSAVPISTSVTLTLTTVPLPMVRGTVPLIGSPCCLSPCRIVSVALGTSMTTESVMLTPRALRMASASLVVRSLAVVSLVGSDIGEEMPEELRADDARMRSSSMRNLSPLSGWRPIARRTEPEA